jgi:putative aldouronate transport system substrate-binding protein
MTYVTNGLIMPLSAAIEEHGYWTRRFYEANPYVKPFVSAPDGEIYFFSTDVMGTAYGDPYAYQIRGDWLEELGLDIPKSLDDWYEAWIGFRDMDPNGNGDVIPFMNANLLDGIRIWGNAFGLKLRGSAGFSVNSDGVVQYDYVRPEARDFFTWINMCYEEDLIDKEFNVQTMDMNLQKVTSNRAGSIHRFLNSIEIYNKILEDASIDGWWTVADPPYYVGTTNPSFVDMYGPAVNHYAFSADTRNFDIKFKFIDYVTASPQGNWGTNFGIEGHTFEVVNGVPHFTEAATNDPERSLNDLLRTLGAQPSFVWYRSLNGHWSHQPTATISHLPHVMAYVDRYLPFLEEHFPVGTLLPEEEQDVLAQFITDIETHRDEMFTRFVMGTESLDNFDAYVVNLQRMGLSQVLEVRQRQYERYKALQ